MFSKNNEEKKLDWMYKGPTSGVDREEYLLGRSVDKTLDQLNDEDKLKQQGPTIPKNRVEHECIPPSIRDFNKVVQAEQVDLSAKLQEDPLVAIRKREEETRREFLQNPVQLKKLQKALKAQQTQKVKKKKKRKKQESDSDIEAKLAEKLLGIKKKKPSKEERNLDIILMHKFEALKDKLDQKDLDDILSGKFSDSDSSSEAEAAKNKPKKKKKRRDTSSSSDETAHTSKHKSKSHTKRSQQSSDSSSEEERNKPKSRTKSYSDSTDSESKSKKKNYGLVNSSGAKIPLWRKRVDGKDDDRKVPTKVAELSRIDRSRAKKLSDGEKERLRREMMQDAATRDKERERNVKKYRNAEEKERKEQDYDPDFARKEFLKSAQSSSVESRIKSNLNNIQRSSRDMDRNFSKRH